MVCMRFQKKKGFDFYFCYISKEINVMSALNLIPQISYVLKMSAVDEPRHEISNNVAF